MLEIGINIVSSHPLDDELKDKHNYQFGLNC